MTSALLCGATVPGWQTTIICYTLLRGYSSFVNPEHFPGMIYDKESLPEYDDDTTRHPLKDFLLQGKDSGNTKVPTGDAALPSPKNQRARGCTPKIQKNKKGVVYIQVEALPQRYQLELRVAPECLMNISVLWCPHMRQLSTSMGTGSSCSS